MFAEIDRDGIVRVVLIRDTDQRHVTIDKFERVDGRREATQLLEQAGYRFLGRWRTNTDGDDIRTVDPRSPRHQTAGRF